MKQEPKQGCRKVTITAGEIEGWTTGDNDLLQNDDFVTALNEAQEAVSRGGKESAEVLITIRK
jgi:hypothetical protein